MILPVRAVNLPLLIWQNSRPNWQIWDIDFSEYSVYNIARKFKQTHYNTLLKFCQERAQRK
jgi:hypothetical protein